MADKTADTTAIDEWMAANGRQKNKWGNYSNKDMADFTAATKQSTTNNVANKRANPTPKATKAAKPAPNPTTFNTEEELMKHFQFQPLDDTSWADQNGNRIMKAGYAHLISNNKDIPTTTITTTEGTVMPVSKDVDPKKLGGVASIEERNEQGDITSTPSYQAVADPDISKEPENPATPPATPEQVQEQVTNEMGITEDTTPDEAKQKLMDRLLNEGFIHMNEDGSISVAPYKQLTKNKLSTIGTALSIALSLATSGVIPALDIGKLTGTAEDEASARKVYDDFMKQVTDTYGDIFRTETVAEEDPEIAKQAGMYGYTSSGAFAKDMQSLENAINQMKANQANNKEFAAYMANLNSKQLVMAINAARNAGISLDEIASYFKATNAQTKWDDALNKANKIARIWSQVK